MEQEMFSFANSDMKISSKNTSYAFWNDTELTDVTLVSSDDKQIYAHKIILCTHSLFFKNIILNNPHPKPLIYLKDVKHSVLISILEFIYLGSCEIANDILEDFLSSAKELKILGINEGPNHNESNRNSPAKSLDESDLFSTVLDEAKISNESEDYKEDIFSSTNDTQVISPLHEGNVNEPRELAQTLEPQNKTIHADESITTLARTKTENTEQITNRCPKCNKQFKYIGRLAVHMKMGHYRTRSNQIKVKKRKIPTECHQCSKTFLHYYSLLRHAQVSHNNVHFPCGLCPKVEETENRLKHHMQNYHTDEKCEICEIVLTKIEMRKHKKNRHPNRSHEVGGICGLCQRFFKSSSGLRHHKKKCKNLQDILKLEN